MTSSDQQLPRFSTPHELLPAIVQDENGEVVMLAWMNAESFHETCESGRACYYSRSRKTLWRKGETSGNIQHVLRICVDCDGDAILLQVRQEGPACHEGYRSCFFRELQDRKWVIHTSRMHEEKK